MIILIVVSTLLIIISLYFGISHCIDNYKEQAKKKAKLQALLDFKNENPIPPEKIISVVKKTINEQFNFQADTYYRKYKYCHYMPKGDNFTYIVKSPSKSYEVLCTVRNCHNKYKPRCEIHKKIDWQYLKGF
nr:MAG TPA: hypothetical protein [Caudoviricetes sp.]